MAASNVHGITLDVINNRVVVCLAVFSDYEIELFRRLIIDAPYIVFQQSFGLPSTDAVECDIMVEDNDLPDFENTSDAVTQSTPTVRPGDPLYLRNSQGTLVTSGSVGYRATWSGMAGYTTAAHLTINGRFIRNGDGVFNRNGQQIGTIRSTQLDTADAAFFQTIPGITNSNLVARGTLTAATLSVSAGTPVILDARNGRDRTGFVRAEWSGSTSSGWISAVRATYARHGGDSGGIVYAWNSSTVNGAVGVHVAGWASGTWVDGGNALLTRVGVHASTVGLSGIRTR
jgi:hypothetical protein